MNKVIVANVKKYFDKKFDIQEMLIYKMTINNVLTKKKKLFGGIR